MPIPKPSHQSAARLNPFNGAIDIPAGAAQDARRALAIERAKGFAEKFPWIDAPDPTGADLAVMDRQCVSAGLNVGWLGLKAKARSIGKGVPGRWPSMPGRPGSAEFFNGDVSELLRAWCCAFAPELLSETAQQTSSFEADHNWW